MTAEGSVPTTDEGVCCTIGDRTALDIVKEVANNIYFGTVPNHLESLKE